MTSGRSMSPSGFEPLWRSGRGPSPIARFGVVAGRVEVLRGASRVEPDYVLLRGDARHPTRGDRQAHPRHRPLARIRGLRGAPWDRGGGIRGPDARGRRLKDTGAEHGRV